MMAQANAVPQSILRLPSYYSCLKIQEKCFEKYVMASGRTDHALRQDLGLRPNLRGALPLDRAIFLPLGAEEIIERAVSGNSKQ